MSAPVATKPKPLPRSRVFGAARRGVWIKIGPNAKLKIEERGMCKQVTVEHSLVTRHLTCPKHLSERQIVANVKASLKAGLQEEKTSEGALASKLVSQLAETAPEVNALCEDYGLRREELGRLTGFSLRALAEWASGKLPSQPARRRLQEVRRLLDALSEIVHKESIPAWLHQPNAAFDGLTPLQLIEVGEIDRLWEMVHDLGSGEPT